MANVVVLIKDERVRQQIETLLGEMDLQDLRTAFFESVAEFEALYFRDPTGEITIAAPDAAEGSAGATTSPKADHGPADTELRLFSEINVFIYALDSVGNRSSAAWLDHLRGSLRRYKHLPATGLRVLLIKYEDDNVPKLDLLHPALDDLLYLPLDRLVFLQKLQIFLSLPKRVSPTYLFTQDVNLPIEISKITKLDRLSDVAIGIRNPVALRKGLPGHFYLVLPGEKVPTEVKGKVLRSEPHPDHPGQFLVYFNFIGLPKATLSLIRRALNKDTHYASLHVEDPARFKFRADDLFLSDEERHQFGVVIIDRDEHESQHLAGALRKEMDRLQVQCEASYSLFLHRYLDREALNFENDVPRPSEPAELYTPTAEYVVHAADQKVLAVRPAPAAGTLLLGFAVDQLTTDPTLWTRLVGERGTKLLLEDGIHLTAHGKPFEKLIVAHDEKGARVAVTVTLTASATEGAVTVAFKPASLNQIADHARAQKKHSHLEALIIEGAIIPPDPAAWVEGLRGRARELGLNSPGHDLKFWVMNDRDQTPEAWLTTPEICGVLRRPVDQRELLFSLSEHLPNLNTVFHFANLGWSQPGLNLHVSKPITLEALSEYGATLRAHHRLAPGTMIYLRKSIYDNAPNQCLAARVYACEEHPSEKDQFQVFVTYWGINDAFLKYARTWIRESYASQKQEP